MNLKRVNLFNIAPSESIEYSELARILELDIRHREDSRCFFLSEILLFFPDCFEECSDSQQITNRLQVFISSNSSAFESIIEANEKEVACLVVHKRLNDFTARASHQHFNR
jgi:hypothetical protein